MSDSSKAVFLSYASQDADVARVIADALRGAGVEVWFDQNELRGGDAWDKKIRTQIRDCTLFLPIISTNTEARLEGYFRLEWKLAEDRSHLMARGKPFLVPVVIDATTERNAHVPEAFVAVQWTRLRPALRDYGGLARDDASVAAFCAQVQRLLNSTSMEPGRPRPGERGPFDKLRVPSESTDEGAASPVAPRPVRRISSTTIWATAAVALLAVAGYFFFNRPTPTAQLPASSPAAAADKSLVVLPLENLSPDPENAFFTDGMHIEIISTLARIADLTVLSRDAAVELKASPELLAAKIQNVGVANVITGSVRRAGNDVRVVLELRRARDHALLWTQTYNKQLGEGVLAIQTDIADQVARVLQARERKGRYAGAQHMTKNAQAYDLFLKANEQSLKESSRSSTQQVLAWLTEALILDPEFVSAARLIVGTLNSAHHDQRKTPEERDQIKRDARRWADTAARLAPGGAGDDALALYYVLFERDPARALPYAQNAARALPNDAVVHQRMGTVYFSLNRMSESEACYRRAVALDPFNPRTRDGHLVILSRLRRVREFEDAEAEYRRMCGPRADSESSRDQRYALYGKLADSAENLRLPMERIRWLMRSRQWTEAIAEIDLQLTDNRNMLVDERHRRLIQRCDVLRRLQREPEARLATLEAKSGLEKTNAEPERDISQRDFRLAVTLSRIGEFDPALAAFQRFVNARSADVTPAEHIYREVQLAEFYAYLNRPRECCELLARLLLVPSGLTVPMLKVDPTWDNVREDAAFKALLAAPKNSAPL
jgi:TolB-like protein